MVAQGRDENNRNVTRLFVGFQAAADFKPDGLIAEFDKLWLPKAPQITELRKVGASL